MKPTILVDADGVLLDFVGAYLDVVEEITGECHLHNEVTEWHIERCPFFRRLLLKWPDLIEQVEDGIRRPEFCFHIRPLPGAQEGLRRLRDIAYVYVVTAPYPLHDTWTSERTEALFYKFGLPRDSLVFTEAKHVVCGDMLIDDRITNLTTWKHGQAVLWDAPHNQDVYLDGTPIIRTGTWDMIIDMAGHL